MPHFLRVGNVTGGIGWLATTVFAQQKRTWKLKNIRIGKEHHLSRPWCWGFHVHFHGVVQHLDSEYSCNSCDCKNIHGQYLPGSKNNDITKLGFISTYNYLCVEQKGKYKIASAFFFHAKLPVQNQYFPKKHPPRQTSLWNWYVLLQGVFCCCCCLVVYLSFVFLFCVLVVFCLLQGVFLGMKPIFSPKPPEAKVKFFIFQIEEPYSTSGYTCWTCDFAVTNHLSENIGPGVLGKPFNGKNNDLRWQCTHLIKQESLEIGSQL